MRAKSRQLAQKAQARLIPTSLRSVLSHKKNGAGTAAQSPRSLPASLKDEIHVDWEQRLVFGPRETLERPAFREWIANLHEVETPPIFLRPVPTALTDVVHMRRESQTGQIRSIMPMKHNVASFDRMLNHIREAASFNASDLHIHRVGDTARIQFRVDGSLADAWELTPAEADSLIIALCQGIATDRSQGQFNFAEFQDAQVEGKILDGTGLANIRILRGPCAPVQRGGNYAALRLQAENALQREPQPASHVTLTTPRVPVEPVKLREMGFSSTQITKLYYILASSRGILINSGPIGSGKTTTLYECCKRKAQVDPGRRLITIERPIEIPMPWAIQLAATEDTLDVIMAAVLRSNPDDIVVQEIQNLAVARIAVQAALTGHFVMSTMHLGSPFGYMARFESFDAKEFSIKSVVEKDFVRGVIAQRLVPLLCPHCSIPWDPEDGRIDDQDRAVLAAWGDLSTLRQTGPGCPHCRSGRIGRRAVAEIVVVDAKLNRDFVELGMEKAKTLYRQRPDADPPMIVTALERAFKGEFDPRDVRQMVGAFPESRQHVTDGDFAE
ncbi:GspE/PulE family protein [Asaia bogorensis]|uniref:Type II secretion system protein GspE n=1 Tax=Asaia bogorensis NBRC 16594 TaxID=1231624 RepID=A0AAN4R4K3_9PROT|nr:ATPase, T2SS/T4P/T4SS family [Asaia bogorensis]GBQ81502.1 type II secretion system protein PilB [Asaia bogorensis NBRC 16594]GEL54846.1 type II secretion system protein GspE [Asaia bogorensis NBRC 16594]